MSEHTGTLGSGGMPRAGIEVAGWLAEEGATELTIGVGEAVRTLMARETNLPEEILGAVATSGAVTIHWLSGGIEIWLDPGTFTIRAEAGSRIDRLVGRLSGSD